MIYTLAFRCFSFCSNWNNFHNELALPKDIFLKNGCPVSLIDNYFKIFLDHLYVKWSKALTAEKKTLALALSFLGELFVQIRTKLQQILKRTLGCCKIQIIFENQRNHSNVFRFTNRLFTLQPCVLCCV